MLEGLAYPTYYRGLFSDLRAELTTASLTARAARRNIWDKDVTTEGFGVQSLQSITDVHVIRPRLFRRLVEPITILSTAHFTHFDTVIEVQGTTVRMTERPENIVFES